ncbi:cell division protein ZapA [Levilactobacillus bambusae]|uniref:Cell division protein ZapA n=1 Tax=Levilactobacillus bambusae TaxID=2024736 RepID=A0A2V1MX35_9LACO|nr:cell division protein ZapA [Levilactobacillus bambusae]PWF99588.1 cell division protein ZapA [Levilactobacillus bambusae]
MVNDKRRFKATINGKTYTIVGNSSTEHMNAVTTMMNEQITQLKKLAPELSREDVATLLAFNAISDQLNKQVELENLKKSVEDQTEDK